MNNESYRALRERAAWIDLTGRGKIRVTGDDRARLLHAMCTNHVQQLQPGTGCYAFFLTAQGRIVADANVFCMPDYLLLDTEPQVKQNLMDHLDKYIIADDVTLHDFTEATATVNIEGPAAADLLTALGALPAQIPWTLIEWDRSSVAHAPYAAAEGYSVFVPEDGKAELIELLESAGVPQADRETADVVRMENGRPRYGVDFGETTLPQETQMMHAVHFSKGCYLGQEIVERVRSRGHVNRLLQSVSVDTETPPAKGTKVVGDGKEAGEITSAVFSPAEGKCVGFAVLRAELSGGPLEANGAAVTIRKRAASPAQD